MLTPTQVFIVTAITQSLLYGIYLATLIQCFRWLIFTDEGWKLREKINSFTMTFATIFIFLTSTTNIITTLQMTLEYLKDDAIGRRYGIEMAMSISALLAVLSIDSVLIYRCWIVYAKSWRAICVPVTVWLASLACSALFSYYNVLEFKGQNPRKGYQIRERAITGIYVCNIATTIYTTTAIIYKIWRTRKTSGGSPKRLNYIMRILAESGILYTFTLVFSLTGALLTAQDHPTSVAILIYDISDAINFSMAGIAFNLLLMRVYETRVELRDSMADSGNFDDERTLSGMQFNDGQNIESSKELTYNEGTDLIREHSRSGDGIHKD